MAFRPVAENSETVKRLAQAYYNGAARGHGADDVTLEYKWNRCVVTVWKNGVSASAEVDGVETQIDPGVMAKIVELSRRLNELQDLNV